MREIRGAFNYDEAENSFRNITSMRGVESMTKQEFRDDADINVIVARVLKGEPQAQFPGTFGDFSQVPDFATAMQQVVEAKTAFDALPSRIRTRFHNNAASLVAFLDDPDNLDEAVRLGLIEKPDDQEVIGARAAGGAVGSDSAPVESARGGRTEDRGSSRARGAEGSGEGVEGEEGARKAPEGEGGRRGRRRG